MIRFTLQEHIGYHLKISTFTQQGGITLIKSDSKTFRMLQKFQINFK